MARYLARVFIGILLIYKYKKAVSTTLGKRLGHFYSFFYLFIDFKNHTNIMSKINKLHK
jgi:hypothetical protein